MSMKFTSRYGMTIQARIDALGGDASAIQLGFARGERTDWPEYRGVMLTVSEAKALGSELIRLARQVASGETLTSTEVVGVLRGEGVAVTLRQLRYWALKGAIPRPTRIARPGKGLGVHGLYTRSEVATIRAYAEGRGLGLVERRAG